MNSDGVTPGSLSPNAHDFIVEALGRRDQTFLDGANAALKILAQRNASEGTNWSQSQWDCFDFVEAGTGNAVVVAVAGSGKTTTGVEMVKRIPRGKTHVFLAFNKAIAMELSSRGINGRTFHSLCFSPVTRALGANGVESSKLRLLIDDAVRNEERVGEIIGGGLDERANYRGDQRIGRNAMLSYMTKNDARLYANFIVRLVGLARNSGIGCLCQNIPDVWRGIVEYHDLDLDSESATIERGIELAMQLLEWSNESPVLDFDDLLYRAVSDQIVLPKFDFVFVDEAQDTNAIQRAILKKIMKPDARLIAVGDPAQAIYGFRGADSDSIDLLEREFDCKRLPLTITYRCGVEIVNFAKRWVTHIEAAPNAIEGSVIDLDMNWKLDRFERDDLIVCRTTRPLIAMAYQFLQARIPARVMGRDIGDGLKSLIKKMNAKGIEILTEKLAAYTEREVTKAVAKAQEAKAESIRDKTATVMFLIEGLSVNDRTILALIRIIDELFDERRGGIILATIHKSKGLEANRVYWLNASQCPAGWAKIPWQQQQERNLCYVAATRAKRELILIEEKKTNAQNKRQDEIEADAI
jgi:DNA helicase II / ATP-dependent DNA helicase PcrA